MNVRFGIIGLGRISNRFAKVLKTAKGVDLVAVASRDQARSDAFARKYGAKRAYDQYTDVINDPEVDIVYDGLTNNFHYEMTKRCLQNQKAVLCEKPFVTSQKDALELTELARKQNTFLMEAMWTRCMPGFKQAKAWVKEGRIGEVILITAAFNYLGEWDPQSPIYNPELGGGSLFDVGVYPIEFATGILGERPAAVNGQAIIAPTGVDAAASFSMRFNSGALASLSCGFLANTANDAVIYGSEGRIELDSCYRPMEVDLFNNRGQRTARFNKPVPDGFIYQIEHSAECFRAGKLESDLIPWQDTIDCAGIFDELRGQWGIKDK
jgi:predicted dehydrogenase